jgi:hypothetical protein
MLKLKTHHILFLILKLSTDAPLVKNPAQMIENACSREEIVLVP